MDATKRNLLIGLFGVAFLLVGMLVYAQISASYNYDLPAMEQRNR